MRRNGPECRKAALWTRRRRGRMVHSSLRSARGIRGEGSKWASAGNAKSRCPSLAAHGSRDKRAAPLTLAGLFRAGVESGHVPSVATLRSCDYCVLDNSRRAPRALDSFIRLSSRQRASADDVWQFRAGPGASLRHSARFFWRLRYRRNSSPAQFVTTAHRLAAPLWTVPLRRLQSGVW
jgi:hypothetical protein